MATSQKFKKEWGEGWGREGGCSNFEFFFKKFSSLEQDQQQLPRSAAPKKNWERGGEGPGFGVLKKTFAKEVK
jgi:hypothetical protein